MPPRDAGQPQPDHDAGEEDAGTDDAG
jgi:hypothetical protein